MIFIQRPRSPTVVASLEKAHIDKYAVISSQLTGKKSKNQLVNLKLGNS